MRTVSEIIADADSARGRGDLTGARALCESLLSRDDAPHDKVYARLYDIAFLSGDFAGMETCAREVIRMKPESGEAHSRLGLALNAQGKLEDAIAMFRTCIKLEPRHPSAWLNLAQALNNKRDYEDALEAIEHVLDTMPETSQALSLAISLKLRLASWKGAEQLIAKCAANIAKGEAANPYSLFAYCVDPAEFQKCARAQGQRILSQTRSIPPFAAKPREKRDKIRVGYFSCTLRQHATGYLVREMLAARDKDRFEIIAYPYTMKPMDEFTQALLGFFDRVTDLSRVSDGNAIKRIREDDLDILIDVDGYANGGRSRISAARCAPVQVNWLGYVSTMGTPSMDYMIGDPLVIPPELERYYDEAIAHLPGGFFPCVTKPVVSDRFQSRADVDLPEDKTVICVFTQTTKILPFMLDAWVEILNQVPDSVLWVWEYRPLGTKNLLKELRDRGIPRRRVVVAKSLPPPDHLCRLQFADLFLDTFPYNAHTTMTDMLHMNVPAVTLMGRTLPSRVAAGLFTLLGLEDYATHDMETYIQQAVRLASDASLRARYVEKLEQGKKHSGAMNGVRYAREFEAALATMAERSWRGEKPATFTVEL